MKKEEGNLPALSHSDLAKGQRATTVSLSSQYWSPRTPGESKRLVFDGFDIETHFSQYSNAEIELEVAVFIEFLENGTQRRVTNGAKQLVGTLREKEIMQYEVLDVIYSERMAQKSNSEKHYDFYDVYRVDI